MDTFVKGVGGAMGCVLIVVAVVALSFALLAWGGALRIFGTQIDRQVNVQSQQYIAAHNEEIAARIVDFNSTTNTNQQQADANDICQLAGEIKGNVAPNNQAFVFAHCGQ